MGSTSTTAPLSWRQARRVLGSIDPLPPLVVPLPAAVGAVLVAPITAATDIPVTDAAAEHGWAVAGQGPWTVIDDTPADELDRLPDRHAVAVAIGDAVPPGATAVVERTRGVVDAAPQRTRLQVADDSGRPAGHPGLIGYGHGIAPQGREAVAGQRLLSAGPVVTPATVALAAAVGVDDLTVIPPASVTVILPNYGMARRGRLRPGRQRDTLAELLPTWIEAGPARLMPPITVEADPRRIADAILDASADLIIVSGGIEPGVPPEVAAALHRLPVEALVPDVAIVPGAGTAVYALGPDRYVVTLPGRPAAAAAGLAVTLDPLLAALSGRPALTEGVEAMLTDAVPASHRTALYPGILQRSDLVLRAHPRSWSGPAGMQGLAAADGLIVCEPGVRPESFVPLLALPGVLV